MSLRGATFLAATALLSLAGCGRPGELALRFEAERIRWRIDREEDRLLGASRSPISGDFERVRALHAEVHRRFGARESPSDAMLRDPDARLRLRIAGASSLYGADLAARYAPAPETVEEFDRIAKYYAFDSGLAIRALFGKGRLLEKLARPGEALASYLELFAGYPPVPPRGPDATATLPEVADGILDLEIHAVAIAGRAETAAPPGSGDAIVERLRARAREWGGTRLEPRFTRQFAEALLAAGRWSEGISVLVTRRDALADSSSRGVASAELGEILERGPGDFAQAEIEYRRALEEGPASEAEALGRLGLARVLLALRRPAEALVAIDLLLKMRARELESRAGEASFLKAKSLADLGRWEDALSAFERVSTVDEEGSWGIVARRAVLDRLRLLEIHDGARKTALETVAIAESVKAREPPDPPFGWSGYWRAPRDAARWQEAIGVLRAIADEFPEESFSAQAREQADRLERERIGSRHAPAHGATIKPMNAEAETGDEGETT